MTCAHGIESATNISIRIQDWANERVLVADGLNDISTLALTANLHQNVNYAIKSAYITPVLQNIGIEMPQSVQSSALDDIPKSIVHIRILSQ